MKKKEKVLPRIKLPSQQKEGDIIIPITTQQIITICKCKHYRIGGIQAVMNYNRLQELLKELGLTEDQVKQCLHP